MPTPVLRALPLRHAPPLSPFRSGGIAAASRGPLTAHGIRTMASFRVDGDIPVTLPDGLSREALLAFPPFQNWLQTLRRALALQTRPTHPFHAAPYALRGITVQAYDEFGGGRLGFVKLTADVATATTTRTKAGKDDDDDDDDVQRLPGSVFLRGPSVAMLVLLTPADAAPGSAAETAGRRAVLTVQARVPAGSLAFAELPAGMVDDDGSLAGAAAREIREELGLELGLGDLTCLSDLAAAVDDYDYDCDDDDDDDDDDNNHNNINNNDVDKAEKKKETLNFEGLPAAMYPSAGGCDEHVTIYLHERRVPREQLREWSGKLTGLRDEGEKITLKLVKMQDLWKAGARDAKCLAAVALWEGLKREGKI